MTPSNKTSPQTGGEPRSSRRWRSSRRIRIAAPLGMAVWLFGSCGPWSGAAAPIGTNDAALLAAASEDLSAFRREVATERANLDARHDALWAEVRRLREDLRDAEKAERQREAEAALLRSRETAAIALGRSIGELLTEYRRASETHLSAAARRRVAALLQALDTAINSPPPHATTEPQHATDAQTLPALHAIGPALFLAEALAVESLPAHQFEEVAFDTAGRAVSGRFVTVGPAVYFVGTDDPAAGVVVTDSDGMEPLVLSDASERRQQALRALVRDGHAVIPVDASGGALLQLVRAHEPLWIRLRKGGVVMVPLLLIGALCLVVAVWRFFTLYRMQRPVDVLLDRILDDVQAQRPEQATALAERLPEPWRAVIVEGLAHRHTNRAYLEEILQDRILAIAPRVSAHLNMLAICAAAAPLLGLLGTVTGMIHTFQLITLFGTGDARTLSGGISEALITTQTGLVIAVPALLAHAGLTRMARGVMAGLEQAAIRFVRHLDLHETGP